MIPILIFIAGVWVNPAHVTHMRTSTEEPAKCIVFFDVSRKFGWEIIDIPCDEAAKEINEKVKQ